MVASGASASWNSTPANESLEDQAQVLAAPAATLVGVFDGHGGPEAARFVNRRIFSHIQGFAAENGGLSAEVLQKAFGATEEEFIGLVQKSWPSQPRIVSVGSCCLVGAIEGGTLYVANLGDSRAVLGRRGGKGNRRVVAERLSRDHNVADEDVRRPLSTPRGPARHGFRRRRRRGRRRPAASGGALALGSGMRRRCFRQEEARVLRDWGGNDMRVPHVIL